MAFDMSMEAEIEQNETQAAASCVLTLRFTDGIFGPVKALQTFAAINVLPSHYVLSSDERGCLVILTVPICDRIERVLAKVVSLPDVIEWSRVDAGAAD